MNSRGLQLLAGALGLCFLLLVPVGSAWACAVCGVGQEEESRLAFIWTTGILSGIPLLAIAGIVGLIYNRARKKLESDD